MQRNVDDFGGWMRSSSSNEANKLLEEANIAHRKVLSDLQSSISAARTAGEALNYAKSLVPHGLWGKWLSEVFRGSHETANTYMRIAREWRHISPRLYAGMFGTKLTLTGALRILREERSKAQVPTEQRAGNTVQPADPDVGGGESQPNQADLQNAVDDLTSTFRESLTKLQPDETLLWSRFLHGDGIAAFVAEQAANLQLVADEVMTAYRRWGRSESAEPVRTSRELEEEFRMEVWRKLSWREDLPPPLRDFVHKLVKDAAGLRGKDNALANLKSDTDDWSSESQQA